MSLNWKRIIWRASQWPSIISDDVPTIEIHDMTLDNKGSTARMISKHDISFARSAGGLLPECGELLCELHLQRGHLPGAIRAIPSAFSDGLFGNCLNWTWTPGPILFSWATWFKETYSQEWLFSMKPATRRAWGSQGNCGQVDQGFLWFPFFSQMWILDQMSNVAPLFSTPVFAPHLEPTPSC